MATELSNRETIVTTIAKIVIQRKGLTIVVRGGIEQAARRGWDEGANDGTYYEYAFGTACGFAYDQGFWAAKNIDELGLERVLEIIRA